MTIGNGQATTSIFGGNDRNNRYLRPAQSHSRDFRTHRFAKRSSEVHKGCLSCRAPFCHAPICKAPLDNVPICHAPCRLLLNTLAPAHQRGPTDGAARDSRHCRQAPICRAPRGLANAERQVAKDESNHWRTLLPLHEQAAGNGSWPPRRRQRTT